MNKMIMEGWKAVTMGNLLTKQELTDIDKKHHETFSALPRPLQRVLKIVERKGGDVAKEHEFIYRVTCPILAHKNGNEDCPSLDVKYDPKTEKVLTDCKVCGDKKAYPDFLKAWGLKPADLKPAMKGPPEEIAWHYFLNAQGKQIYRKVKFAPQPDQKKPFRFDRPDGKGGWTAGLKGMQQVLYRLPELIAAGLNEDIYIVEGEKDVETIMERLGRIATTSGSQTSDKIFDKTDLSYFKGHNVIILPDNDHVGRGYADRVATRLFGVAKSVKMVHLPVSDGEDITDYFEQGKTTEILDALISGTKAITKAPTTVDDSSTAARNQVDNAKRFVIEYKDKIRFNRTADKWMGYDGSRWSYDTGRSAVTCYYIEMLDKLRQEANECKNSDKKKQLFKHIDRSASSSSREGTLSYVKSMSPISVSDKDLDKDIYLLNCKDVTIDLRTGEAKPHDPADMITMQTDTIYGTSRKPSGLWTRCLNKWHNDNAETINYLQQLSGYCATGDRKDRCFPIFHGEGKNGKNTFLETIRDVLGDYATTAPSTLLMQSKNNEHSTEIADLAGRRLVIADETEGNKKLKVGLVKAMTGGLKMKAHFMRQDLFEFCVTHKLILMTNNLPVINETVDAIWDRLHLVKWPVKIKDDEQDGDLPNKLKKEWPAILHWMVSGCVRWQEAGRLIPTDSIVAAGEAYRASQNPVQEFIDDECTVGDELSMTVVIFKKAYDEWVGQSKRNRTDLSKPDFNVAMAALGYVQKQKKVGGKNLKRWLGIAHTGEETETAAA